MSFPSIQQAPVYAPGASGMPQQTAYIQQGRCGNCGVTLAFPETQLSQGASGQYQSSQVQSSGGDMQSARQITQSSAQSYLGGHGVQQQAQGMQEGQQAQVMERGQQALGVQAQQTSGMQGQQALGMQGQQAGGGHGQQALGMQGQQALGMQGQQAAGGHGQIQSQQQPAVQAPVVPSESSVSETGRGGAGFDFSTFLTYKNKSERAADAAKASQTTQAGVARPPGQLQAQQSHVGQTSSVSVQSDSARPLPSDFSQTQAGYNQTQSGRDQGGTTYSQTGLMQTGGAYGQAGQVQSGAVQSGVTCGQVGVVPSDQLPTGAGQAQAWTGHLQSSMESGYVQTGQGQPFHSSALQHGVQQQSSHSAQQSSALVTQLNTQEIYNAIDRLDRNIQELKVRVLAEEVQSYELLKNWNEQLLSFLEQRRGLEGSAGVLSGQSSQVASGATKSSASVPQGPSSGAAKAAKTAETGKATGAAGADKTAGAAGAGKAAEIPKTAKGAVSSGKSK